MPLYGGTMIARTGRKVTRAAPARAQRGKTAGIFCRSWIWVDKRAEKMDDGGRTARGRGGKRDGSDEVCGFFGAKQLTIEDRPVPAVGEGQGAHPGEGGGVCGTDVHIYEGGQGAADCPPGTVLGHEFSGIVAPDWPGGGPGQGWGPGVRRPQ